MKGDTDILDAEPRKCGMCEKWEQNKRITTHGRCPVLEEAAKLALSGRGLPELADVHIHVNEIADATLCIDFEWSDAALGEAVAIAQYHATRDVQGRAR